MKITVGINFFVTRHYLKFQTELTKSNVESMLSFLKSMQDHVYEKFNKIMLP